MLVLDLGHIAFRRDDLIMRGDNVDVSPGDGFVAYSAASGQSAKEEEGVLEQGILGANGSGLMAVDNWRLDVSGVQVKCPTNCSNSYDSYSGFLYWLQLLLRRLQQLQWM